MKSMKSRHRFSKNVIVFSLIAATLILTNLFFLYKSTNNRKTSLTVESREYISNNLGIKFKVSPQYTIEEKDNRISLDNDGQWLYVFNKESKQNLEDFIKKNILKGYSLSNCKTTLIPDVQNLVPSSFSQTTAIELNYNQKFEYQDQRIKALKSNLCPSDYVDGVFITDTNNPQKVIMLNFGHGTGRYRIRSSSDINDTTEWYKTIYYLK